MSTWVEMLVSVSITAACATAQLRDSWWADVPDRESDTITQLCRDNGTAPSFKQVRARRLKDIEHHLQDNAAVAIDPDEASRIAGQPPDKPRWESPYLVRGLRIASSDGAFTVHSCGSNLLVGYVAAPGATGNTLRSALVVELASAPIRVFVTSGVGVR
jgi:hypothetical protein